MKFLHKKKWLMMIGLFLICFSLIFLFFTGTWILKASHEKTWDDSSANTSLSESASVIADGTSSERLNGESAETFDEASAEMAVRESGETSEDEISDEESSDTHDGTETTGNVTVPDAPSVNASSARWNAVKVSWEGVEGADGYRIYRKTSSDWEMVGDYKSTTRWVVVSDLEFNREYTFTVSALVKTDTGNVCGPYSTTGASAMTALNEPEPGEVFNTENGLKFTWTAVKGAEGYHIYRKNTASGSVWQKIAELDGQSQCSYVDENVTEGNGYCYTVEAYRLSDSQCILSTYDDKGVAGTRKEPVTPDPAVNSDTDPDKPMVALTYDDGPSANTPKILDVLEKYGARATFFVVGNRIDDNSKYQSYVKRAYELGCQIGNHTYEHEKLTALSENQISSQISRCDEAVKKAAGIIPSVMRPPGGNRNSTVDGTVGKPMILWSVDTMDWKTRDASQTISAVLDNVKDGDIILMHDLYASTAEASETIIPALIERGYQLVTVEELAESRGGMKAGNRYSSFRTK